MGQENEMRIFGYILALVGFVLIIVEVTFGQGQRKAIWIGRSYQAIQKNDLAIDSPVAQTFADMNRSWAESQAMLAVPAIMMIVGAVFLDQARRNGRKKEPEEPQQENP